MEDKYNHAKQKINELIKIAEELENDFKGRKSQEYELYIFTTYCQIIKSIKAFMLLIDKNYFDDAQIIMRSIYEKFLNMKMVINSNNYFFALVKNEYEKDLKLYDRLKNKDNFYDISVKKLNDLTNETTKNLELIKNKNLPPKLNTADLAGKIGMSEFYVRFQILSRYTHNQLGVVFSNITFKKEGVIINTYKDFPIIEEIAIAFECAIIAIKSISDYLKNDKYLLKLDILEREFLNYINNY